MNKKIIITILTLATLTGCVESGHEDIKDWMNKQEKSLKGKIENLPTAKTFSPTPYDAKIDPFVLKEKVSVKDLLKNKYAPELERDLEDLEYFDLNSLRMVGTVNKDKKVYAMIRDNSKNVYYVTVGNHMGKNHGKVISLNDGELVLDERFKENEEWVRKETKIYLFDGIGQGSTNNKSR